MEIIIQPTPEEAADVAAQFVAHVLEKKPDAVLGLATGNTPLGLYRRLIAMELDWSKVTTFNLDEYVGLSPEHPQSYHAFMWANLFRHVNIAKENVHLPDGNAKNIPKFCAEYEQRIKDAGGIDLQILGIGSNGHIGFNEPTSSLTSRTRLTTLTKQTRQDNARFFRNEAEVPLHVITMGVGTIMEARQNLLLAFGSNKARAVALAIEGGVTSFNPASALQMHPDVKVCLDETAAHDLQWKQYYHSAYQNRSGLATILKNMSPRVIQPSAELPGAALPVLSVAKLPVFDKANLDAVRAVFRSAPCCVMQQAWQEKASPGFLPAIVWVGWRADSLWIYVELMDVDIFTQASATNQRLWEWGDVFEVFLRPANQESYVEFQIAPNNQYSQFRYTDRAALEHARKHGFARAMIPEKIFSSQTWIREAEACWHLLLRIPAAAVGISTQSLAGQQWRFSFSRYDYTRGAGEPVISSTSLHARADFHRQEEWGLLDFQASA